MAPRIAEHPDVLLPVLVCLDGFTITHSAERVVELDDDEVRAFVGEYRIPDPILDLEVVTTHGPFAMPDYYYELRAQQTAGIERSAAVLEAVAEEYAGLTGRRYGAFEAYRLDGADRAIVCLGSTAGTVKDVVDELRGEGVRVGLLRVGSFRPFPREDVRRLLHGVESVAVLDRASSPGGTPPLLADVASALYGAPTTLGSYIYGLGGREIHADEIRRILTQPFERDTTYVGLRSEPCPV
jgi:pyruvate ferredoxin oxidoreductase alpha subunit